MDELDSVLGMASKPTAAATVAQPGAPTPRATGRRGLVLAAIGVALFLLAINVEETSLVGTCPCYGRSAAESSEGRAWADSFETARSAKKLIMWAGIGLAVIGIGIAAYAHMRAVDQVGAVASQYAPRVQPATDTNPDGDRLQPDEAVCPYCAETIKQAAKKCKHCGSSLAT